MMAMKSLIRWRVGGVPALLLGALLLALLSADKTHPGNAEAKAAILLPDPVQFSMLRQAAARYQSGKNLRNLARAMQMYADSDGGRFPPQATYDKNGKSMLSWRVLLLPYLDQTDLFKQFHLYEPWDSEHNKKLLSRMPKVYAAPQDEKASKEHTTYYQGFVGRDAFFEGKKRLRFGRLDFPDGLSLTIMIAEASKAVPWTKPEDIAYDAAKPLPKLGLPGALGFSATMCDGSIHWLSHNITEEALRNAITRNDGSSPGVEKNPSDDTTALALQMAVQKAREIDVLIRGQNNLQQIAIAMHHYATAMGIRFPPQATYDKKGKPMLSWRVLILPYLDQADLYKQFHLDEPWDSEHNKKLLPRMPKVYAAPQDEKTAKEHTTYYQGVVGKGTFFEGKRGIRPLDILDGTTNTIMLVEASKAVPWTKPEDVAYDAAKPLPKLGILGARNFSAVFCDGSIRLITPRMSERTLRAAITRNDGTTMGPDFNN